METGGHAGGQREGDGGLALAGAVVAALLVANAPVSGPPLAALTALAAALAVVLRFSGNRPARAGQAIAQVPFALALTLAGAAVWSAVTGRDPATGLVATGLVLVAARIALPGRGRWIAGAIAVALAGVAALHRLA